MSNLNYITTRDVVERIWRQKKIWYNGIPDIIIEDNNDLFGYIRLDFHDGMPIKWRILMKDKEQIRTVVEIAVINFDNIINEIFRE